ncbi:glycoside hydrolase family 3 protein, partial [Myxococcota bacterium]
ASDARAGLGGAMGAAPWAPGEAGKASVNGSLAWGGSTPAGGTAATAERGRTAGVGGSKITTGGTTAVGAAGVAGTAAEETGGESDGFEYPAPVAPWEPSPACVDRVATLLSSMSLRQKAAQMVQADSAAEDPAAVANLQLGSILSGGGSDPTDDSAQAWRDLVQGYEAQAAGFGIPLLYGVDAVHGHNNVSGAVIFPHNIGLGATRNPELLREIGRVTAREMRGTSIDWTFAPTLAVARDERWGRTYESYSEVPELVAQMGVAMLEGLQGTRLGGPESVLGCAKHFAGDGATSGGEDQGDVELDDIAFRRLAVDPYQPLINAGVGSIMVSYSRLQGTRMSAQSTWLTDVLKGEMGFRGFLISDWAAVQQLPGGSNALFARGPTATQVATAVNAGIDMIMEPYAAGDVVDMLEAAVTAEEGDYIAESRIDSAVTRILTVKCELGMLEPGYDFGSDAELLSQIGSEPHRKVARQAVRESLVLLKNEGSVLPLPKTVRVHVAGSGADSLQRQCGGWTIDWQGLGVVGEQETPGTTTGTTILQGIHAALGVGNVSYSLDGNDVPSDVDYGIVVMSEAPYAEGKGDEPDLDLDVVTPDVAALNNLSAAGVPVVVVLLSGRPLIIGPYLDRAESWIAAWLPGTEGAGVADVLFGDYGPTGRLSHDWPRTASQIPINVGDSDAEDDPPLYPFGYGLSY